MNYSIQVTDLRYRYPKNAEDTLQGLNFNIEPGKIFGFLGPSGSGKSTTQKILYKLLNGYSGRVQVYDRSLANWDRSFYNHIGVSFELPNHYLKLTGYENLQYFASFYGGPIHSIPTLLERVGLWPDAHKRVADYSKGMKMRLNFIRALLHNPEILFLDEPTSGLDPMNGRLIKDMILELKKEGKTIFITTHSMFDADQLCDRIALLAQGDIKALDSPTRLKQAYGERKVLVEVAGGTALLEFPLDQLGSNSSFLQMLQQEQIRSIHSQEATLEEVFIKVTGTQLT